MDIFTCCKRDLKPMAKETMLSPTKFNVTFHVHTDAGNLQLERILSKENKKLCHFPEN